MKKTELKVIRYEVTDTFFVEVIQEGEMVGFWLCHKGYAIKDFMFGCMVKDCPESEYEDFIERNVYGYMACYIKDREREELDNEK